MAGDYAPKAGQGQTSADCCPQTVSALVPEGLYTRYTNTHPTLPDTHVEIVGKRSVSKYSACLLLTSCSDLAGVLLVPSKPSYERVGLVGAGGFVLFCSQHMVISSLR